MVYLNYTVVGGAVTPGAQSTIDAHTTFQVSGNIWSLDGPTLGYLASIAVAFVSAPFQASGQTAQRVVYDPRPLNGSATSVNFSAWGTAYLQPDGRYIIDPGNA
jgi:hypothetical protein